MSGVEVLRLPLAANLAGFVTLLRRLRVPHRVIEQDNQQVLWVPDAQLAEQVRELYQRYPQGLDAEQLAALPTFSTGRSAAWWAQLRVCPMTLAVLLVTLVVTLLTRFGNNIELDRWLTFVDFRLVGDQLYFLPPGHNLTQAWRLFSPMLLHFGVLHLAMNGLWYWELGRRIEYRHNGWVLLGLTLVFSLASNIVQYRYTGPALFGGLSGVLYGLLGYCWILQKFAPHPAVALPTAVVAMMLVWLLICLTGVMGTLGLGQIANGAHVGGLVAGCLAGAVAGLFARARR